MKERVRSNESLELLRVSEVNKENNPFSVNSLGYLFPKWKKISQRNLNSHFDIRNLNVIRSKCYILSLHKNSDKIKQLLIETFSTI